MHGAPLAERFAPSCYQAVVDPDKCTGCQTCVTRCNFMAIEIKRYPGAGRQDKFKAWVDPDKCEGCGLCVMTCPAGARTLKQVKTGDSIPRKMPTAETVVAAGAAYLKAGKHLDTGSVMPRPLY